VRLLVAIVCVVLGVPFPSFAEAGTINVPQDRATIQEAIDAAEDGDEIRIGRGVYAENVVLAGRQGLSLVGVGRPTLDGSLAGGVCLAIRDSTAIRVTGISFVGAGSHAVHIERCDEVDVSRCRVTAPGADGIRVDASTHVFLSRNRISRATRDAIALSAGLPSPTNDSSLLRNVIRRAGRDGIALFGDRNVVQGNRIRAPVRHGVRSEQTGCSLCLVATNTIVRTGADAVSFDGVGHTFRSNKVDAAGRVGLRLGGTELVVDRNRVRKSTNDGFYINATSSTVTGNRVLRTGDDGFEIEGTVGLFEENRVRGAGDSGFQVDGTGNSFIRNRARGSANLDCDDLGGNTYTDNRFPRNNIP
jgi:hypothetical protein